LRHGRHAHDDEPGCDDWGTRQPIHEGMPHHRSFPSVRLDAV
jgi:hypothetical protein